MDKAQPQDRRRERRIRAAVYCRPAGMEFLARQREPVDVSLGGIRIYSDDALKVGELLKMEFFLPDTPPVTYTAEVVWIETLEKGAPAHFDVGLKFIQLEPAALALLMRVLGPPGDEEEGGDGPAG
jgi:c-di-GMP-binding flagellar brake protein YcgR